MFWLIIHLPCFNPCVLLCCLVFCSVLSSPNRSQESLLCECALRHRSTRELYSNNFRAVGLNHAHLKTNRTENKTTKQDTRIKTR